MGIEGKSAKSRTVVSLKKPKSAFNAKRHRFVKHSVRAKAARTMTGKNLVTNEKDLAAVPEGGITSCFMKEALEEENLRNPSKVFTAFYRAAFALVQSQALLVHNLDKLIDLMVTNLKHPDTVAQSLSYQKRKLESLAIPSVLRLVAVLVRDISPQLLYHHLEPLTDACLSRIDPSEVDNTTLVFQTIGKLFERCAAPILENDAALSLQTRRYPQLLGHSSEMIRNLSAEMFAFLIRQQEPMERKKHTWSLLKAPSETYSYGVSSLLLFVVKGVQSRFHSNMEKIFGSALRALVKNKEKSKSIQQVKTNLLAWSEAMREWSQGIDDEVVLTVFAESMEGFTDLEDAAFIYDLARPWINACTARSKRNREDVCAQMSRKFHQIFLSVLTSQLQEFAKGERDGLNDAEQTVLSFALDYWLFLDVTEEAGSEQDGASPIGQIIMSYLSQKPHNLSFSLKLLNLFFIEALVKLDFLSQFVPYLLPHVPVEGSFAVWSEVSRISQGCIQEDAEAWQHYLGVDSETSGLFSMDTGLLKDTSIQGTLLDRALRLLKPNAKEQEIMDALKFLSLLEPSKRSAKLSNAPARLKTVEPIVQDPAESTLRCLVEESPRPQWFGLAVKAALNYCGESAISWLRPQLLLKLTNDAAFISNDSLDALKAITSKSLTSEIASNMKLLDVLIGSLSSTESSIRRTCCGILTVLFPQFSTLPIIQSMHDLEATYESERPRQIIGDSLALHFVRKLEKQEVKIILHGILGLYHVRFRPSWGIASSLLEKLAKQHSDLMWKLGLFEFFSSFALFQPVMADRSSTSPEQVFHHLVIGIAGNPDTEVTAANSSSLLKLFRRENKNWMFLFFRFLRDEFYATRSPDDLLLQNVSKRELELGGPVDDRPPQTAPSAGNRNDNEDSDDEEDEGKEGVTSSPTSNYARKKLLLWLQLLCGVTVLAEGGVCEAVELHQVCLRLLLSETFASSAFKCLANMNREQFKEHRQILVTIAEGKAENFRNTLSDLSQALATSSKNQGEEQHRLMVDVASRLLFGKLVQRPGKRERFSLAQRRRAVFSAFSSLSENDGESSLQPLFRLMLRPFNIRQTDQSISILETHAAGAEGYLSLLKEAVKVLGKRMLPFVAETTSALCTLVRESCFGTSVQLVEVADDEDDDARSTLTTRTNSLKSSLQARIRSECLARLAEYIEVFSPEFDFTKYFLDVLGPAIDRLSNFDPAPNESPSVLLKLVSTCLKVSSETRRLIIHHSGSAFGNFLKRIEMSTHDGVVEIAFSSIDAILEQGDAGVLVPFVRKFMEHISRRKTLKQVKELEILGRVAREVVPLILTERDGKTDSAEKELFTVCSKLLITLQEFVSIKPRRANDEEDSRIVSFETMIALARNLPSEELELIQPQVIPSLSKLFGPWGEGHQVRARNARDVLVRLFAELSRDLEFDDSVALGKLNSWLQGRLDNNCDFETRLGCYHELVASMETKRSTPKPVLINQALFDMANEDFALRTVAQTFAISAIKQISQINAEEDESLVAVLSMGLRSSLKQTQNVTLRGGYLMVLRSVVQMANTVKITEQVDSARDSKVIVPDHDEGDNLGVVGENESDSEEGPDIIRVDESKKSIRTRLHAEMIAVMDDSNHDLDFFMSASHVQNSRRTRILTRLSGQIAIGTVELSQDTVRFIILPLALHGVFLESATKGESESGITLASSCASRLNSFSSFAALLQSVLKRIPRAVNRMKVRILLRCACGILDAFPAIDNSDLLARLKDRFLNKFLRLLILQKDKEADEELNEYVALSVVRLTKDNDESLNNVILQICGQLKRRKQSARDSARSALRKILAYLGVTHFPRIFGHLRSTLREGGYQVHVLGYTVYILVDVLKAHMLGSPASTADQPNTTAFENELEESAPAVDKGESSQDIEQDEDLETPLPLPLEFSGRFDEFRKTALDSILDDVMQVLEDEIFGENAPTQENGYKAKVHLREIRAGKTMDTLESLASCIAFLPCDSVHKLTRPFLDRLSSSAAMLDPKVLNKCREGFYRVRRGLLKNPDVRPEHLLVYVHNTLSAWTESRRAKELSEEEHSFGAKSWLLSRMEDSQSESTSTVKGGAYASRLLYQPGTQLTGRSAERARKLKALENVKGKGKALDESANAEHLFIEFCLDLMTSYFFRPRTNLKGEQAKWKEYYQMIVPLLQILVKDVFLKDFASRRCMVIALLVSNRMLEDQDNTDQSKVFPPDLVRPLVSKALKLVKQHSVSSATVSTDVARASMDTLGTLLQRDPSEKVFHQDDIKLLIRAARLDLEDGSRLPAALKLLKCIFERKVLLPEMYDVALRLSQMVFQSAKDKERSRCADIVAQFLMDYPLEEKRVQEQVDLVMKNLDFPHESGRIAGLNMLRICIIKFPKEFVDESAEFFFLSVILRLVNDDSASVKEMAAKVCVVLVRKLSEKKLQRLTELSLGWFAKSSSLLAACQACGVLVESGRVSNKGQVLPQIADKLCELISQRADSAEDWEIIYCSLISLEKVAKQDSCFLKMLDSCIVPLLVHSHAWVRLVSSRLLNQRMNLVLNAPSADSEVEHKKKKGHQQTTAMKLEFSGFDLVLALVDQLDSDLLSDELAALATANFIDVLRFAKMQPAFFYAAEEGAKDPVSWAVKRLSVVASRPEREQLDLKNRRRRTVFTIFLTVCEQQLLDPEDEDAHRAMVKSAMIIHVADPKAIDPLKDLCDSVTEAVKSVVGSDRFVQYVNDIRNLRMEKKREKRKAKVLAKVLPLPDPQLFPKRIKQ